MKIQIFAPYQGYAALKIHGLDFNPPDWKHGSSYLITQIVLGKTYQTKQKQPPQTNQPIQQQKKPKPKHNKTQTNKQNQPPNNPPPKKTTKTQQTNNNQKNHHTKNPKNPTKPKQQQTITPPQKNTPTKQKKDHKTQTHHHEKSPGLNQQQVKMPVKVFSDCSDPEHNIQNDKIKTYLKNARVAQADTSLSYAALEQAKIRQVAHAWSS